MNNKPSKPEKRSNFSICYLAAIVLFIWSCQQGSSNATPSPSGTALHSDTLWTSWQLEFGPNTTAEEREFALYQLERTVMKRFMAMEGKGSKEYAVILTRNQFPLNEKIPSEIRLGITSSEGMVKGLNTSALIMAKVRDTVPIGPPSPKGNISFMMMSSSPNDTVPLPKPKLAYTMSYSRDTVPIGKPSAIKTSLSCDNCP